jgi:hypothetical protein
VGRKETFNIFPAVESLPDFVGIIFDGGSDFYAKQSFPGTFFLGTRSHGRRLAVLAVNFYF